MKKSQLWNFNAGSVNKTTTSSRNSVRGFTAPASWTSSSQGLLSGSRGPSVQEQACFVSPPTTATQTSSYNRVFARHDARVSAARQ